MLQPFSVSLLLQHMKYVVSCRQFNGFMMRQCIGLDLGTFEPDRDCTTVILRLQAVMVGDSKNSKHYLRSVDAGRDCCSAESRLR